MDLPRLPRAHLRGATTGVDHGLLQFGLVPADHFAGHFGVVGASPEDLLRRQAMMRRVGVQADPAVGGGVVASHRIPHRRHAPTNGPQGGGKPERGQAPVDFKRR
jgi:hypothetical protein